MTTKVWKLFGKRFVWRPEGNEYKQSRAPAPELSECARFRALHPPVLVAVTAMALGILSRNNMAETEGSNVFIMTHGEDGSIHR